MHALVTHVKWGIGRRFKDLQESSQEDGRNAKLTFQWHLQLPDDALGEQEVEEV